MADGFFPLTSEQQEWAARAADLAQRELAPRAAETDRTGTFPSDGLEALKREGFLGTPRFPRARRTGREPLDDGPRHGGAGEAVRVHVAMLQNAP
jgi:alkylation response protein AidB-like acyl-CoA dehydrogenase